MALTLCNRCGDAVVEEGCNLRDELAELDALLERLALKRLDQKERSTNFIVPSSVYFLLTLCRPFSSSAYKISRIINFYPPRNSLHPYLLGPFAVIGETLLGQRLPSGLRWWFVIQTDRRHI